MGTDGPGTGGAGGRAGGDADADEDTPLETVAAGAVTALTLLVAFGLLAAGVGFFWVAFPVGFGALLPTAVGLARLYERRRADAGDGADDALAELRRQYVDGDLSEAEFERRLDRLLSTESETDARASLERAGAGADPGDVDAAGEEVARENAAEADAGPDPDSDPDSNPDSNPDDREAERT